MLVNVVLNLILYEVMGYRVSRSATALAALFNARCCCGSSGAGWVVSTEAGSRPRSSRSRSRRPAWPSRPGTSTAPSRDRLRGERAIPRLVRLNSHDRRAVAVLALMARALRIREFTEAVRAVVRRLAGGAPAAS